MSESNTTTRTFISVHNCRFCGSIIPSLNGIEGHKNNCRFLPEKNNSEIEQFVVAHFPLPTITLERISSKRSSDIKQIGSHRDIPLPLSFLRRKSSLRALEKLRQETEDVDDTVDFDEDDLAQCVDRGSDSDFELEKNEKPIRTASKKGSRRKTTYETDDDDQSSEEYSEIESMNMSDEIDSDDDFELETKVEKTKTRTKKKHSNSEEKDFLKRTKTRLISANYKYDENYFKFRCNHCPARFHEEIHIKRHEYNVHGEGSKGITILTCPLCQRMFNGRLQFQAHVKGHENGEDLEQTFNLWKKWPSSSVTSRGFSSFCKYCVIPMKNHDMFVRHMEGDHKDQIHGENKYSCMYCSSPEGHNLDSMKLLIQHIKTCHDMEYYGKQKIPEDNANKAIHEKYADNEYACPLEGCGSRLKTAQQLKSHFLLHLKNNPYACPIPGCNTRLDAACHYKRHMEWHMGKNLIPCERCGIFFCRREKMLKHLNRNKCKGTKKAIEIGKRKNFLDANGFVRSHFARVKFVDDKVTSSGQKKGANAKIKNDDTNIQVPKVNINAVIASDPVFIEVCKKNPGFKELILRKKGRSYGQTGSSETYKCGKCERTFVSMNKLKVHDSAQHAPRPHQCSLCLKSFLQKRFLTGHMKFHESCGNVVFYKHLENGSFQCVQCEVESSHELGIKRHYLLIHKITVPVPKDLGSEIKESRTQKRGRKPISGSNGKKKASSIRKKMKHNDVSHEAEVPVHVSMVKIESEPPQDLTMIVSTEDVKVKTEPLTDNLDELRENTFHRSNVVAPPGSSVIVETDNESVIVENVKYEIESFFHNIQ